MGPKTIEQSIVTQETTHGTYKLLLHHSSLPQTARQANGAGELEPSLF